MPDRAPDKFIAFHRVLDACRERGCPVCACVIADTRRYLEALLREHVTDPESRARLRAAWGFCNWHAWMLRETGGTAFGTAILAEDLLRVTARRLERAARPSPRAGSLRARLSARVMGAPAPLLTHAYRRRPPCPACAEVAAAETRYLDTAARFGGDAALADAYEASDGLCVPHALGLLEAAPASAGAAALVRATLPKWAALRRELEGFTRKHAPEHRASFTEAEASAPDRATEALAGRPGLFGNDRRRGGARRPRR